MSYTYLPIVVFAAQYYVYARQLLSCGVCPGACSTAHGSNRPDQTGQLLDNFNPYPVEQNGSDCRQAIHSILFYWIRMKVVQQLTCLTLGRPNGPAYLTDELLNTPLLSVAFVYRGKRINHIFTTFSPLCSHTILVFSYQTLW